ncbi:MAG: hypothetical protein ACXVAN_08460 [Polyangia bacterium]
MKWMAVALLISGCATSHSIDRGDDERPRAEVCAGSARMRNAGYVLVAVGGVFAVGAIAAGAASNPSGCHDESCWLPQLTAGLTLGVFGGSLAITGAALAIAGRDRQQP